MGIQSQLTEHLADALDLSDDAISRAQRRAGERGGDVASQLIIMDVVDETDLIEALADHHDLPGAELRDYSRVDKAVFDEVTPDKMRQYRLIPFRKHRRSLAAWVVEPLDDDEVAQFEEEHQVNLSQLVWPLLRYREALHTLLGDPLADWARAFIARAQHSVAFERTDRRRPSDSGQTEAVDPRQFGRGWSLDESLEFISACYDRDALLYTLLGHAERWFDDRLMVVITDGAFQPYMLVGWEEIPEELRDLSRLRQVRARVPADAELLVDEHAGRSLVEEAANLGLSDLFDELSIGSTETVVTQTVRIGSRISMALIGRADTGLEEALLDDFEQLEEVASAVGAQLQQIIVRLANAEGLPPAEERIPEIPSSRLAASSSEDEALAVPGQHEETATLHEESSDAGPGATAFGIPFADEAEGEASEPSRRGIAQDSSVSIMTPVDVSETSTVEPHDGPQKPPEARGGQNHPEETHRGGFSVSDYESHIKDLDSSSVSEADGGSDVSQLSEASNSPEDEGPDLDEALSSDLTSSNSREEQEPRPSAPMAQILRPVSLKTGKQSAVENDAEQQPAPDRDELASLADKLESSDPDEAFSAADRIARFGEKALEALEASFPGRPFLDRYQYTVETMPPITDHTPVMRALVAIGPPAASVARGFLDHTSVELRFYATALFSELPAQLAGDDIIERLFDRDQQTRQMAKEIVVERLDTEWFDQTLSPLLYEAVEPPFEERRLEVAAELLGRARRADAVEPLIEALEQSEGRVQERIHGALRAITYKAFVPSASEWKHWWKDAHDQPRRRWLVEALDSELLELREMVAEELDQIADLEIDYHPDQPPKLRRRAQQQLESWFDEHDE